MATPTIECPACNRRLVGELRDDQTYDFRCASCGWGSEPLASTEIPTDIQRIKWRVLPYWVLSLCFGVLGYWVMNELVVATFDFAFPDSKAAEFFGNFTPVLIYLTITLPLYLLAAWLLQPEFHADETRWFGGPLNNPFTWTNDYDSFMMLLAIFLWPGKFMIFTVQFTLAVWRGK